MAGSKDLFDRVQLTQSSEYATRNNEQIRYLQIHHATMTSLSRLISMMQPGGRTVSANGAMSNTGELVEVVPLAYRPFTSATGFDRRCLTVECCNTTLAPSWGISAATRTRLARLALNMFRQGLLPALTRQWIIGHYEVPGTYATACPGPDMHLDAIVAEAVALNNGSSTSTTPGTTIPLEKKMTPEQENALNECRRMLGVILGWNPPGNAEIEGVYVAKQKQLQADAEECRRMLGVLLGWNAPTGPETVPGSVDLDALVVKLKGVLEAPSFGPLTIKLTGTAE